MKNFDIVFTSGNMTDIFLDTDYMKFGEKKIDIDAFLKQLNDASHDLNAQWYEPNQDYDLSFSNDDATFNNDRQKQYIVIVKIKPITITLNDIESRFPEIDVDETKMLFKTLKVSSITFDDCVLKFGFFGDVSFRVRNSFRKQSLDLETYFEVSSSLHTLVHHIYKKRMSDLGHIYIDNIIKYLNKNHLQKILIDLDISSIQNLKYKKDMFESRALFSIVWTHYIYDDEAFKDYHNIMKQYRYYCEEINDYDRYIYAFRDARVYVGWEHSFIIYPATHDFSIDEDKNKFYILPFEVTWAEWEFSMKIICHLDKLLHEIYQLFDKKNYFFHKTKHFKQKQNNLLFFINKVIHNFDDKSVTLNQRLSKMIQRQRKNWSIDDYNIKIEEKSNLISDIVGSINDEKKIVSNNFLNIILFFIAVLSTFEIVSTIRDLIISGDTDMLAFSLAPGLLIFVVYILYNRMTE